MEPDSDIAAWWATTDFRGLATMTTLSSRFGLQYQQITPLPGMP